MGLHGLGKTKAFAEITIAAEEADLSAAPGLLDGVYSVVLQTPALLCDPRYQSLPDVPKHGALIDAEVHKLYAAVWSELSGELLQLDHYYASQSLAGGNYLHHRFQTDQPYNPWLLTDAGSVFVLRPVTGKLNEGEEQIRNWLAEGLPLPKWARETYGGNSNVDDADFWKRCPFIRQNGFGEVGVNHSIHTTHRYRPAQRSG